MHNRHNKKKGVVLWGSTSPHCLGYQKNINLSNKATDYYTMRPLCSTVGDIFNKDGSPWKTDDNECMNLDPDLVLEMMETCIEYNDELGNLHIANVIENRSMINVNEKTRAILGSFELEMQKLNERYQTVIDTYVASQNKEGNYNLSSDGKRLIKVK